MSTLLLLGLAVANRLTKHHSLYAWLFSVLALLLAFLIGILSVLIHLPQNIDNHYSQAESFKLDHPRELVLEVNQVLKPSMYYDKYFVNILEIDDIKVSGKLLLNVDIDTLKPRFKVDDILFMTSGLVDIKPPQNPHQFDYSRYLERKYIYHQVYVPSDGFLREESESASIKGIADKIRQAIKYKLEDYAFSDDQLAIINAILLGQKLDLSQSMYQQYAAAGVIHILAVSGLHVGIILIILQFILKPLEYLRQGRIVKICAIVILLWCFAVIAGLSPSVTRAVTMFSIVAIGMNLKRPTNIFNSLAISIFVILLVRPMFLFEVGFQLSYLAVFSIVWIQPMLRRLWTPRYLVIDYYWSIFTVTIAAQIGVAPLSLYYFHQFPGLFFLSNLMIIPALGAILGIGILVVLLAMFNLLPGLLVALYGGIIDILNDFIAWIAKQESFLFEGISFGLTSLILSYLIIIFGIQALRKLSFARLFPLMVTVIMIQGIRLYDSNRQIKSFIVFQKSRQSLMASRNNESLRIYHSTDSIDIKRENSLKNYVIGEAINNFSADTIRPVYRIHDQIMLVVDSLAAYDVSFKPDLVLLCHSPKINLERLIETLEPRLIIADGSNYKSYVARWEQTCSTKKLPFHATAKKGALTIDFAE